MKVMAVLSEKMKAGAEQGRFHQKRAKKGSEGETFGVFCPRYS